MSGPVTVANGASAADKLKAGKVESEHTKAATAMGMDGCGLPIVVHGDFKIYQSFACQNYFASIGPNYPKLTAQEQAVDDMFMGALEDCMGVGAGVLLSGYDAALARLERDCPARPVAEAERLRLRG